jgi:hypothetical protein
MKRLELVGQRFGRLVVIKYSRSSKNKSKNYWSGHTYWECQCDCGKIKVIKGIHLKSKTVRSCGCLKGKEFGVANFNRVYRLYVSTAKKRGLEFSIDKEYFKHLTTQNCHYCGVVPSTVMMAIGYNGKYVYNGVDRVDSSIGYTKDNCVPCCTRCNLAKNVYSAESFKEWIVKAYNHITANHLSLQ